MPKCQTFTRRLVYFHTRSDLLYKIFSNPAEGKSNFSFYKSNGLKRWTFTLIGVFIGQLIIYIAIVFDYIYSCSSSDETRSIFPCNLKTISYGFYLVSAERTLWVWSKCTVFYFPQLLIILSQAMASQFRYLIETATNQPFLESYATEMSKKGKYA